jgi:uncharacterized protein YbbC (DUF1343 family)
VADHPAIDLLTGGDQIRKGIDANLPLAELRATWQPDEDAFAGRRSDCLIY